MTVKVHQVLVVVRRMIPDSIGLDWICRLGRRKSGAGVYNVGAVVHVLDVG
jgi:hypothetical protein